MAPFSGNDAKIKDTDTEYKSALEEFGIIQNPHQPNISLINQFGNGQSSI